MKSKEDILVDAFNEVGNFASIDDVIDGFSQDPDTSIIIALDAMQSYADQFRPKWISVEEGLPDFDVPVLVFGENNPSSIQICRLGSVTEYRDSSTKQKVTSHEWYVGYSGLDTWYYTITHWQPIEPPKSEQ